MEKHAKLKTDPPTECQHQQPHPPPETIILDLAAIRPHQGGLVPNLIESHLRSPSVLMPAAREEAVVAVKRIQSVELRVR